ncbi:fimbrial protein [Pseudomonas eucalypticola]|uniref:Type 1 fimbrial protein n=1 Tax=Pseudomonas eucalypticola TaxID=2599595 RepID=A0A7D5HES4_9PSED|nr:fimbrial protein [Pseudomonas eucalypticola]QKZ05730.1 type 1 fimbrial protein [Pseudomonas eucalypticola]
MKKQFKVSLGSAVLSLVGLGLMSQAAVAADAGTITFNGKVTDETCEVTTGSNGDFTVDLATAKVADLAQAGDTAVPLNFRIAVNNCSASVQNVRAQFLYDASLVDLSTGLLKNQLSGATAATQVGLQLFNIDDNSVIKPGDAGAAKSFALINKAAEMTYGVQYYATGASTAGLVKSQVKYQLSYN